MIFSWHTFLMGAILGIIQFGLGLWIGKLISNYRKQQQIANCSQNCYKLGNSDIKEAATQENAQRLQAVTSRVQNTVQRISNDVSNHQVRIEQITRELHVLQNRSVSVAEEVIWERLNQLLRMTGDFSDRLSEAESQIKIHSKQIAMVAESQNVFAQTSGLDELSQISQSGIHPVGKHNDAICYPEVPGALIPDETVSSITSLGNRKSTSADNINEPDDVDAMLENVRSRLSEVISSTTEE